MFRFDDRRGCQKRYCGAVPNGRLTLVSVAVAFDDGGYRYSRLPNPTAALAERFVYDQHVGVRLQGESATFARVITFYTSVIEIAHKVFIHVY